jgi:DNA-binding transcriptional LysR family regulator
MNKFAEMHLFVNVVDAGSMAEAARRLGKTKSVVTLRLQQLEQRLGASLLERGRQLRLTGPGQIFYAHSVRILAEVSEAEDAVMVGKASMRGHLRIAAPMAFGIRYGAPMLAAFAARHPDLRLDIESDDRYVNLHDESYDFAIRLGTLADSDLIAKPIAVNRHLICASPAYLREHGVPLQPADLHNHNGLLYVNREAQGMWQLPVDGELRSFRIRSRMRTDSGHQLLEATRAGVGLAILPTFLAADAIVAGELVIVLRDFAPSGGFISAVYRKSHRASPKIHALVDSLTEQIGQPPVWDQLIADHLDD